jgi:hypothetical protein
LNYFFDLRIGTVPHLCGEQLLGYRQSYHSGNFFKHSAKRISLAYGGRIKRHIRPIGNVFTAGAEFAYRAEMLSIKMWSLYIHISPFRVLLVPAITIGKSLPKTRTKTEQNQFFIRKILFAPFA